MREPKERGHGRARPEIGRAINATATDRGSARGSAGARQTSGRGAADRQAGQASASAGPRPPARPGPLLPQVPIPGSSAMSLPTICTLVSASGPLPINVAPFDRRRDLAVLDQVGLAGREHELAGGDIHLAAAEVHRVEAALDRSDHLLRRVRPAQHHRVGHARHRRMGIGLAAAVPGRAHRHQARVQPVLKVVRPGCRPRSARCGWSACPHRPPSGCRGDPAWCRHPPR